MCEAKGHGLYPRVLSLITRGPKERRVELVITDVEVVVRG